MSWIAFQGCQSLCGFVKARMHTVHIGQWTVDSSKYKQLGNLMASTRTRICIDADKPKLLAIVARYFH